MLDAFVVSTRVAGRYLEKDPNLATVWTVHELLLPNAKDHAICDGGHRTPGPEGLLEWYSKYISEEVAYRDHCSSTDVACAFLRKGDLVQRLVVPA